MMVRLRRLAANNDDHIDLHEMTYILNLVKNKINEAGESQARLR